MDLSKYHISQKAQKGLLHWKFSEKQGEKHCLLCKKHGGPFKSHNTHDCHHFNKDRSPIKGHGGASRPQPNMKGPEGAKFVQMMRTETKKALYKCTHKDTKCCTCEPDSDSDSNNST